MKFKSSSQTKKIAKFNILRQYNPDIYSFSTYHDEKRRQENKYECCFQKSRHNSRNISITIKTLQLLADSDLHCGVSCLTLHGMGTSLVQCSVSGTKLQWLCMVEESATRNTSNSLHIYLELSFSSYELRTPSHHQAPCSLHFQQEAPSEAVISYVVLLQFLGVTS